MIRYFLFVGVLIVGSCISCKPQDIKVNYVLSDEQLAHLILDVQLGEVAINELTTPKQDSLRQIYWLRLTTIYKMTEPDIKEEIQKVESDPAKYKAIMERVQILSDSIR
jgi:hypothetical protein